MPAIARPAVNAFRKTLPAGLAGLFAGAFALIFVSGPGLATDPQIAFIERSGTNWVTIHFNTDSNRTYILQYSSDLNSGTWSNVYTATSSPAPSQFVVVKPTTNCCGFYRLAVTP